MQETTQETINHYKTILLWLKTQSPNYTPAADIYQAYYNTFKNRFKPLTRRQFSHFLRSQNIHTTSTRHNGRSVRRYDTWFNNDLVYIPVRIKQPCEYCSGKGYIERELTGEA